MSHTTTRRAFLGTAAAALPALLITAPALGAGAADPDAPLVAAWQRHRAIAAGFAGLDARDEEGSQRLADELAACNMLIVETPCHGATGAAVKLRLLAWLHDSGTEAEWEGNLVRSALAVLERGA